MRWIVIALSSIFLWSAAALGWGNPGHATVCQIAYLNLTATAKAEVDRLVPLGPRGRVGSQPMKAPYDSFSRACTFPDNPHTRGDEHFVNYDRSLRQVTATDLCSHNEACIFSAIDGDLAKVASTTVRDRIRAEALFYLGHWVGDLHQPLHVSFGDDHGGGWLNTAGVAGQSAPCRSDPSHPNQADVLHTVWDKCLVEQVFQTVRVQPGNQRLPATTSQNQWTNARAAAAYLNSRISAGNRTAWIASPPWRWAAEGYQTTLSPGVGYCVARNNECWYSSSARIHSNDNIHEIGPRRTLEMRPAYLTGYRPLVEGRLQMAGIRLAHMLNIALDPAYRAAHPHP